MCRHPSPLLTIGPPVFALGFRPFYLLAAALAVTGVAADRGNGVLRVTSPGMVVEAV